MLLYKSGCRGYQKISCTNKGYIAKVDEYIELVNILISSDYGHDQAIASKGQFSQLGRAVIYI